jgi:hypothetical protein
MQKGKQQPVLDRSKASDMNMAVLKRIDSQIEEVCAFSKVEPGPPASCCCRSWGAWFLLRPLIDIILIRFFVYPRRSSQLLAMCACTVCLLMISSG